LRRVFPRPEVLPFTRKDFIMKQAYLSDMFKKVTKSLSTSNVVSPDPLSPTPSVTSAMKTAKTQKKTLITLNQQVKEIPKWNTLAISCTAQE
jgi:hypothetical protein